MSKKGFTLLELTLAIAIFSIGILGIIFLFPQGLKSIKTTIVDLSMSLAADNIIEIAKEKYQSPPDSPESPKDQGLYIFELDEAGNEINQINFVDLEYKINFFNQTDALTQIELILTDKNSKKELRVNTYAARKTE